MNPTEESFTRTRLYLKQIIKHHFVLGNARIHVALKTITADKRQLYGLPSFRFFHKTGNFVSQNLIIFILQTVLAVETPSVAVLFMHYLQVNQHRMLLNLQLPHRLSNILLRVIITEFP